MKLRIKGNSLRLRLTRSEVSQLATDRVLFSETNFGNRTFRFGVELRDDASGLSSAFEQDTIMVSVPGSLGLNWAVTEEVGVYGEQTLPTGGTLIMAVEKDFRCLDPRRDEDESDNFDNPLEGQTRHAACDAPTA